MKDDIIVLHAKDVKRALTKVANRPFAWLYLGQNINQRENISQVLGKENRYLIGDLLQKVAHKEKQPFLDFIAELAFHQKSKLHWWASNIAYKSPLASDFFLLWCYATVFEKVCSEKSTNREGLFLVFIEDRWLYRYLWRQHEKDRANFCFLSRKSVFPETLKLIARGIVWRGYFLLKTIYQIWLIRRISPYSKISNYKGDQRQIYIYSEIADRCFQENGIFTDTNFGRLPEFLSTDGLDATYITPPFVAPHLMRKCLNCDKATFIVLDQYITFYALVRNFFSFFTVSFPTDLARELKSLKILLHGQVVHEYSTSFKNTLYYYVFKKWLKGIDQRKITIIYPFENQPWEKMLCLAAKELSENIRLVGYQHSTVPELLLNYFPGKEESSSMPLPHLILTNGEYTLSLLTDAGYEGVELANGGALRYEYLHKREADNVLINKAKKDRALKTGLVALAYSITLTEELLLAVFNAFTSLEVNTISFVVKSHPWAPLENLGIQLSTWPSHFKKTDKPVSEVLKQADLVIYSSSTIGLEALLSGVPIVRYHSEHILSLDPLDALSETVSRSCSGSNVKEAVLSTLYDVHNEDSHLGQHFAFNVANLNKFFSPVNEDVWKQVVKP